MTDIVKLDNTKASKKKYRKVCIVGSAPSSKGLAPWDKPNYEFWCLAWRSDIPVYHRLFDMHTMDLSKRVKIPKEYPKLLMGRDVPVYLQKKHPQIPKSVAYPLKEVAKMLGEDLDPYADGYYFYSSIAYMVALAIYEHVTKGDIEELRLYGVDLLDDTEYVIQRPNCEYLLGIARAKGLHVYIPEQSALLNYDHMYGYEDPEDEGILNRVLLEERMKKYQDRHNQCLSELHTLDGALQELREQCKLLRYNARGGTVSKIAKDSKFKNKHVKRGE